MELEAKWQIREGQILTPEQVEAVEWEPYALGERHVLHQINLYFDTADRVLGKDRRSLRLRDENGQLIVTLKGGGQVDDGVHRRDEMELHTDSHDPELWPAEIMNTIEPLIRGKQLTQLLRIENERQAWSVMFQGVPLGELALDAGNVIIGARRELLHELEWELRGGEQAHFDAVYAIIRATLPVVPSNISKFQRGLQLLEQA